MVCRPSARWRPCSSWTRLPIRLRRQPNTATMVVWFPAAGMVIGAIVGGIGAGMWELTPPLVAGAIAVTAGLLVTGAFHEDGLGDIADAFGGGYTVERRLEIMKDSPARHLRRRRDVRVDRDPHRGGRFAARPGGDLRLVCGRPA